MRNKNVKFLNFYQMLPFCFNDTDLSIVQLKQEGSGHNKIVLRLHSWNVNTIL